MGKEADCGALGNDFFLNQVWPNIAASNPIGLWPVPTLLPSAREVVSFHNQRGQMENFIKEGKYGFGMNFGCPAANDSRARQPVLSTEQVHLRMSRSAPR